MNIHSHCKRHHGSHESRKIKQNVLCLSLNCSGRPMACGEEHHCFLWSFGTAVGQHFGPSVILIALGQQAISFSTSDVEQFTVHRGIIIEMHSRAWILTPNPCLLIIYRLSSESQINSNGLLNLW